VKILEIPSEEYVLKFPTEARKSIPLKKINASAIQTDIRLKNLKINKKVIIIPKTVQQYKNKFAPNQPKNFPNKAAGRKKEK